MTLELTDCDVHTALPTAQALKQYLASRWHGYYDQYPRRNAVTIGLRPQPDFFRRDTFPAEGGPGSDLELMREQLLDRFDVQRAIVSPLETLYWPQQGELSLALHAALNDSTLENWLARDGRLFGAITVPIEDAVLAAREIERAAADPRFVMVLLTISTRDPLGHSRYWPIYEAAAAHGLPVGIHIGGFSGAEGAAGYWAYHVERRSGWPLVYAAQTVSLVSSGVFDRFPELQVVLEEGGLAWLPPLLWRLERSWEEMRDDVPEMVRPPGEVVRSHFWFTTQPLDDPEKPEYLVKLFEHLDLDDRILFSSDYPHFDFDDPNRVLPASVIGAERRARILSTNAASAFPFPS
jgi:predicted TIM-barrel fold metal-dependent hydrolase